MNLFISILPTILILAYVYKMDIKTKEPPVILIKMFLYGMFLVFLASFLENAWIINPTGTSPWDFFKISFMNVALIEEGLKYLVFILFIWKDIKHFDELYDGIVYCVFISLGFATLENILYVMTYGFNTGVIRAVTAVPLHTVCAVIMGAYLSKAKFIKINRNRNLVLALLFPVLLHGLYNFILFLEVQFLTIFIFPLLLITYYNLGINKIRELSGK